MNQNFDEDCKSKNDLGSTASQFETWLLFDNSKHVFRKTLVRKTHGAGPFIKICLFADGWYMNPNPMDNLYNAKYQLHVFRHS